MKTKPLTFLLSFTFLFLFSGSSVVFSGVFDKKDESVVMICKGNLGSFSINMKEEYGFMNHHSRDGFIYK